MADGTDPVSLEEQRRQAADRLFAQEMADEDQRKAFRQQSWDMTQPPPDQAGEALQLGNKFGVPRKAVEADPDYWKRRDQEARRKLLVEASPRTMAWLDDEDNYAVAKDDVDILSQIESTFSKIGYAAKGGFQRFMASGDAVERQSIGETMEFYRQRDEWEARQERRKKLGQDAPRGWRTVRVPDVGTISGFDIPISYGNLDTAPAASGIVREEVRKALPESMRPMFLSQVGIDDAKAVRGVLERRMTEVDMRARARQEEFAETLEKARSDNYIFDNFTQAVTAVTENAPTMAAFFALRGRGGATVGSVGFGAQVAGAQYLDGLYSLNLDERDASDRALLHAGVEILTERISLGFLDEMIASNRSFLGKLLPSMAVEQVQEQVATLGGRTIDLNYVDLDMPLRERVDKFIAETPETMANTAMVTLFASGMTNTALIGLDTAVRDMVERSLLSQPSAGDAAIDAVLKKAKESRLGKRSPEKLKDVLDRQAAGTGVETVTVDLDELAQALKEKGVELSDALDGLGVPRDELQQKWENFGEIEVKLSDLATSDLMRLHGAETQANTRRNDDPYTPARKEKMRAALEPEMQETAKRIYDDLQNGADMAEKEQQVADRVRARIRGAGILAEREQENASVAIQTAMVTTLARRIGIDPVEFYDQHYPRIQGNIDGMVAEEGALESGATSPSQQRVTERLAFFDDKPEVLEAARAHSEKLGRNIEESLSNPGFLERQYLEDLNRKKNELNEKAQDANDAGDAVAYEAFADQADEVRQQIKTEEARQKQAVKRAMEEGAQEPRNGLPELFHGGRAGLTLADIQIVREPGATKQGKKNRVYGGFYGTSKLDEARGYANATEGSTVYRIELAPNAKVETKEGEVTRLSAQTIQEYRDRGVDVVVGKDPRGRTEYVVVNKDAITGLVDTRQQQSGTVTQDGQPEGATSIVARGEYSRGLGAFSVEIVPEQRADGSYVLTRKITDESGERQEYFSKDGSWQSGRPSTVVFGANIGQITEGPEVFPDISSALQMGRDAGLPEGASIVSGNVAAGDLLAQEITMPDLENKDEVKAALNDPETDVLPLTEGMQILELDEFIAFHGTTAKFDQFKSDKIGAGEGAQAFGPGHYFTQSAGVANWYRKRMKKLSPGIKLGKESFNKANPAHFALAEYWKYRDKFLHHDLFGGYRSLASDMTHSGALERAIFSLQYEIDQIESPFLYPGRAASEYAAADRPVIRDRRELAAFLKQGLAYLKTLDPKSSKGIPKPRKPTIRGGGNIYTVAVKLPAEATIQYDKPFGQQPAAVQKAFREAAEAGTLGEAADLIAKYGAATRMGPLVAALKKSDTPAMEIMRRNGVRGVRYLDGMSRGKRNPANQTFNYVVFNDGDVKVLDRKGLLFQELDQQRRGQFSPSRNIITMFEAADVTTLMHEGAHWYLAEIERMAMAENPHPFVTEQWEAVKKWGKVGPDFRMYDDMGRVTPEGRELQEAFAETFEVYLQTGKAPVPSLREAFRAFKQWITALWRDIRTGKIRLPERASLSPEITRVMDRMLAVDEEIESQTAEVVTKAEAMANDLYDRGIITKRQRDAAIMNLEQAREAAKEDLMAQIMQAELRVREAQLSAEQRRIKGDVTREYDRSTVGRAVSWLGYGTWKGDVPVSETEGLDSEVEFYQSIRAATRMPMEDIYAWVVNNVDSKIQQFSSGDEGTMMSWRLSDAPDAPRVLLSIRLSRKGRADVNLFLNNKMADALDEISDPVERSRIATEMFSQAIMVMRQYSAETPDLKAFNFIAAENEKAGRKAKSREELYRFMLSTMRMDGYTAYEIGSQTSVVRQADGVKSADPLFDGAGFVMIRDGVDVDEFARNEILRGSQSGGDAGEVVTALTAVRLSRPARGGVDRGRLEAGRADPGGAVDDTLGQEARKVDTSVAGGLTEKSFIGTRDLEGATIFPMFADLTDAGSTFAALDGLPIAPTPYLGGPNFPWLSAYRDAGIVWAFNAPGVITKVRNKVKALQKQARAEGRSDRVIITMLAMKDDAHTSNEMVISALLRTLDAVVEAGRFPQEQLAEAKRLIVSKAGKKDEGYSELATFPGFDNAEALHDWSRGATFAGRKALAKEMRSAKFQQLPGMFPVERIVREAIDPDYRATQQGDALLAFEIDPDAEDLIIDFDDPRSGNIPRHPAYRYGMRGELVGSFSTHIPMEVLYGDLLPKIVNRAKKGANPKFLMERLKTADAQVVTEDIIRTAKVIEGLHDYRIAQAHTAGIAGQWRSSDAAANKGGVNPVEFERALLENEAAATLTPYTRTDVTKGKKDGSLRVFQLGEARVQDGGLNVWMAVKTGYDYRNEYPGEVTDALVEQGILTDNEVALVGVASNELGVKGMATFQVLKGIEEGVTVLDAFKVTSPSKPDGLLPTIYATLGFEEVGQIPFDPKYYDAQQLADLKAIWTRQGWSEADGYPAVAIMKWRGDDAVRPEATRRFILESQEGLGIGSTPDVAAIEASTESVRDSDGQSDQGNGLPGQGDGRADPRRFADRARGVSDTVRSYVENILAADARAIKALKLPQELIDRIRAEYGPALEQTPDDTLGQEAAPTFYSALGRFIASSNTARAPAAQWKGMISNAPGVKAEEVEWSGVMDWLDASEGPVTREELAAFVEANGVRVEEVVRGAPLGGNSVRLEEIQREMLPLIEERDRIRIRQQELASKIDTQTINDEEKREYKANSNRFVEIGHLLVPLQQEEYNLSAPSRIDTKWSSFTLPGGENYREMLLTLPPPGRFDGEISPEMFRARAVEMYGERYADNLSNAQKLIVERAIRGDGDFVSSEAFRGSHWSEPNVLAHVRFKERTGPNGERVLALEEVQSDWHQAGRERGYKPARIDKEAFAAAEAKVTSAKAKYDALTREARDLRETFIRDGKSDHMLRDANYQQLRRREDAAYSEWIAAQSVAVEIGGSSNNVPNAPFKNNAWANLVLKRMIRYAAENGFDAVAWIPGNVQNGQIVEDTGDNRGDFYDKIVPNLASKLGKKYGAKVTKSQMDVVDPSNSYVVGAYDADGNLDMEFEDRTEAIEYVEAELADGNVLTLKDLGFLNFWTLPLTPELATAAMTEGFPLFQRGDPKGWGETAPPPDLPPMRLDLEAVRELYGEDAVRRLPKPIRDRSRDKTSIDGMMDIIRANVKTLKRKPPMTLFQYIRSRKARTVAGQTVPIKKWGIKGAADELKAMNREDLINETNGIHIDYVRESAAEAGYLPEDATLNDFLNAIDREARGEPVYSRFDQKEVEDQRFAKEWADWLDSQGVDMFEANQKKLKAEIAKIVTSTAADARTPDEIAAKLGFADGETMLNMLALMGNRDQYVKEETDRRMREEFGDPMADGTFEEEARVIAEAEVMSRAAEIEMEALARAVGEPAASKLAKEMAMDSLGLMTVKELEGWERFLNAERREMNNTLEAVKRGDMVQAFIHKRRQLVNMHLARAAREKSIAIEKTRKDLLTYYSSKGRRDKIAPDYLEKIEALLEGYELRVSKQGPGEQKRRMSAKEYVDDMDAQGREDQVAPEARLLAELSDKKVWRTLTADEVDYVAGTVRNIAHLGRTKDKLMRAQEKRRFQAVIGALVDRMNETGKLPGVTRERSPTRTASELAVDMLREGHSWLMRPEHQARSLDGAELGPVWEALFRPMAEAADVETQMMREATRLYREAWSKFSGAERNAMSKRTVSVPELPAIGKRFTQLDIISIALNWGVTYNREVLLEGYGWTADQVEAALFRTMTDKHWDLVESLWAISGMYKAEAFALEKAMTGVEPKAVEGISFTLPSGRKIDGKYYHIQYDANQPGKMSRRQAKDNDAEALTAHRKSRSKAMTKNGGLIERKGSGGRKVKLGLSVFEKAMSETIHDIAFRRAVFDVGRIIADDNFADTYQEVAGMEAYRQLNVWLKDIAMPPMEVLDPIVKAFAHVRRNIPLAVMGYKVGTALIQPTGLLAAMPLVGHRRVLFAVAKAFANPKGSMYATWKQVADMSEFMRDRVAGYERDVRETTTAMTKGGGLDFIRRNAFAFITGIDIAVSVPTWMAAYGKAMDGKVKGIQAGVEEDAVAYADSIIRRTQTAGKTQDLSRFQRGGEFQKQISMIFGYFNNLYSLSAQQTLDMRRGNISRAEWAWHMSVLFVAIPLLAEVFAGRLFPDDEDDEETIEGKIAETVLLNFTGMFPGLRDAVALNVKPEFGYRLSPTSKFIEDIGRTAGLPAQLALDDERELKEADVRRAVNAVGALTGLPSAQINITGNYIIDALQGEEDPTEDPVDAAREALVRNTR